MISTWSGLLHVKDPEGQTGCQVHSFFPYAYSLQAKSGLSVLEEAVGLCLMGALQGAEGGLWDVEQR